MTRAGAATPFSVFFGVVKTSSSPADAVGVDDAAVGAGMGDAVADSFRFFTLVFNSVMSSFLAVFIGVSTSLLGAEFVS